MLDTNGARPTIGSNERLHVTSTFSQAALEMRSWLPEHRSGEKTPSLDGRELPGEVGATLPGPLHILCLAPGEWLLVSNEQSPQSICDRFAAHCAAQGAVLIDATDAIGVMRVQGLAARDVLSKGCGLDLHPSAMPVGRCARTRFAQMPVIVHHLDDGLIFHLYVARSYLRFLADWIADAATEFNSGSAPPGE